MAPNVAAICCKGQLNGLWVGMEVEGYVCGYGRGEAPVDQIIIIIILLFKSCLMRLFNFEEWRRDT